MERCKRLRWQTKRRVRAHTEVCQRYWVRAKLPDDPIEPAAGFARPVRRAGTPGAYFFLLRLVPVVPTMTTTFVWGEKACSMRCFPFVVRMTIPL